MSQILSEEEVNALLGGVAQGVIPAGPDASRLRRGVRTLDLTSQERSLRGRLPGLELVVDRFVRALRASLGGFLGQLPAVTVAGIELVRFARVTERLPQPVSLQLFRMAPLRGQGMLVVTPPLVAGLLQVFFGGSPSRRASIAGRDFSAIELRALERFGARVLQDLEEAWRPVAALELAFLRSETNPLFALIAAAQDLVFVIELRLTLEGGEEAPLTVCIPHAALDPIRSRLQTPAGRDGETSGTPWGERLRAVLADAELEISAELGTHRMSLRDVLGLKVGDLIPLRTGRDGPVVVRVEGWRRFLAAPGVSGGSNAIRVTERAT